jgi:hypothetical protein
MKRRHRRAFALVALLMVVAVTLLWPRDHHREEVVATCDASPVSWLGLARPENDVVVVAIRPDGRPERVKIVPFNWQPTFWEWVRSWLDL